MGNKESEVQLSPALVCNSKIINIHYFIYLLFQPQHTTDVSSEDGETTEIYRCRDNLLDHIIDMEKSLLDRLTQLEGFIDGLLDICLLTFKE